ncbi:hypothetical protein ABK040_012934 [Willaertia magna]
MGSMHKQTLDDMIVESLGYVYNKFNTKPTNVAVTIGPGLPPCLKVGLTSAKKVASELEVPLIPIHHLEGHLLMPLMNQSSTIDFPYLVLLVSGGHCLIAFAESLGNYEIIGTTQDDSIGECYDKTARLLQSIKCDIDLKELIKEELGIKTIDTFPISGGKFIETLASKGDHNKYEFTIPMRKTRKNDIEYSFSGLKSDVLRVVKSLTDIHSRKTQNTKLSEENQIPLTIQQVRDIAASFQYTACTHILDKLELALNTCASRTKTLIVSGGVSSNSYLRSNLHRLTSKKDFNLYLSPISHCTDNAVMIAFAALRRLQQNQFSPNTLELDFKSRFPINTIQNYYEQSHGELGKGI